MERTMKIILCGILTVALAAPALFAQSGTGQRGIRAARLAQIAQERKNEEEAAGGTTQPGGFGGISIAEKFKSRLAPDPGTETAEEPAEEAEPASVADRFKSRLAVNGWGGGTDEGQSGASRFETIGFNSEQRATMKEKAEALKNDPAVRERRQTRDNTVTAREMAQDNYRNACADALKKFQADRQAAMQLTGEERAKALQQAANDKNGALKAARDERTAALKAIRTDRQEEDDPSDED